MELLHNVHPESMCPDCGGVLVLDGYGDCVYALEDPEHGEQSWWLCNTCSATWEDEEL